MLMLVVLHLCLLFSAANAFKAGEVEFLNSVRFLFDTDGNQVDAYGSKISSTLARLKYRQATDVTRIRSDPCERMENQFGNVRLTDIRRNLLPSREFIWT